MELLSADELRTRLGGKAPESSPDPEKIPCRSGHTDCTVDCGWCKGTGFSRRTPNPLDMPGGGTPDIDITPPQAQRDLVASTLDAYRSAPHPPPLEPGKPAFRRGVRASEQTVPMPPTSTPQAGPERPNKYGGKCTECAVWIGAEEGLLTKTEDGKWGVKHLPGGCAPATLDPREGDYVEYDSVGKTDTERASASVIKAVTGQVYSGIHPGIYTVETEEGHRTFRVRVQGTEEDFAPGQTILEYLVGPDNGNDYVGIAFLRGNRPSFWKRYSDEAHEVIRADAKIFLDDPDAALKAKNCIRCNAILSVPESVIRGMGPTCMAKGW